MRESKERLQRKIFQPSEETNVKIKVICEATGMSLSELINSLFDTIKNAEDIANAYNEARAEYLRKVKNVMRNIVSEDDSGEMRMQGVEKLSSRIEEINTDESTEE